MKRRIACLVDYYLPGSQGGGPIRTIENMVEQLGDEFEFCIVTRDRDLNSCTSYENVKIDDWNIVGKAKVFYASPAMFSYAGVGQILDQLTFGVLYLNSFFSVKATIFPSVRLRIKGVNAKRIVLAPRGEFSRGALDIKSFKKNLYLGAAKMAGLYDGNIIWQASSEYEAADIRRVIGEKENRIVIAADLLSMPEARDPARTTFVASPRHDSTLRIIFISRISPKKNLCYLLDVLGKVTMPVQLSIYGPVEDNAYWAACQSKISGLPANIKTAFFGSVEPDQVQAIFAENDLFVFPTLGENFGHVIFESLRAGTPVIISDQTPWQANESGAVTVLPLEEQHAWVKVIDAHACFDNAQHAIARQQAFDYALTYFRVNQALDANRKMFEEAFVDA